MTSSTESGTAGGRSSRRAAAENPTASADADARAERLEAQIERLQADLKAIAGTLAGMAESKVSETKRAADREVRNLSRTGQMAAEEVRDEFSQLESHIKDTIREKPLTAVAGAAALGFLLAVITR